MPILVFLVYIISSFLDYFALYRSIEIFHYLCFFQLLDDFGINFYFLCKSNEIGKYTHSGESTALCYF